MKDGKLKGKVAVVTGASKGIGAGIAKEFAAEGAAVVVNYSSAKEDADRVVDQITKRGGQAIAVRANVHQHFGEVLAYSCSVGGTHWDALGSGKGLPGPRPLYRAERRALRITRADLG